MRRKNCIFSVIFGIAAVLVAGYACRLYKNPEADARKRQQVEESIARSYLEQLKKDDAAKSDGSRNVLNETESEESETKGSDSRDTCLFGTFASESLEEETMTPRWDDKNYYVRDGITYTPDYARGTLLGVLEVDHAGIRRGVYGGTWEDIQYDLDIWMTTAARPDYELGKTHFAIYGHNHTVQDLSFNRLKDVVVGDVFTYTTKDGVYIYDVTRFFADWREIVTKDYVDNFSLPADKCYIISCGRNEYRYKDIVVEGTLRCVVSMADYEKAPDYYKYSYDGENDTLLSPETTGEKKASSAAAEDEVLEENEDLKKEAEGGRQTRINISLTDGVFSAECVDDAGKKVSCEMALLDADGIAIMRWKQPEEHTPFVKLEKNTEYAAVVWKMEDSDAKAAPDVSFLYHDGKLAHKKTDERLDENGAPMWAKPLFIGMAALFLFLLAILLFPKRRF